MAVEQRKSAAVIWAFAFAMVLMIGAVAAKGGDGHGTGGRPQIGKSSKSAAVAAAKLMPQDMILGFLGNLKPHLYLINKNKNQKKPHFTITTGNLPVSEEFCIPPFYVG
ncbi:hypothetical protein SELMODRAFT_408511 [Selaginella moellendorffii]|uniref:Uncharacterized protein n=1 Tax=Selaginella moellendorffii TaxID=88036 RepID=D8R8J2_SELML|nr:hypothetical protein SELMODRAFT_408511 [Selaginella moellendorffii]